MAERILTVCVIVNKHGSALRPSETFIREHVTGLAARTLPLIGTPATRRTGDGEGEYLLSRRLPARATRWLLRATRLDSVAASDTRSLVRYLRAHAVDVVLAEYGPTAVSVLPACERAGIPLVAHFHGYDAYRLPRDPQVRAEYARMFQSAAAIVGVSRHMVGQLVALGAPADKVVHNVYGTRLHERPARPAEVPARFVAVGRLTPKKAPLATIRAFAAVRQAVDGASLDIIGDGPLRPECEAALDSLRVRDSVRLHGVAAHDQVFDLLRTGRCFVQHSVTAPDGDSEGTPVSVLEAMAMGLPIVATRHAGIPDVVEEGSSGVLVDEHDVDGMAAAMLRFARDGALAQRAGSAARAAVARSFTLEKSLQRLLGILERAVLVGSGSGRRSVVASTSLSRAPVP
jgi:colanic acid/amylovoran biosynthesis glycosyltransferase